MSQPSTEDLLAPFDPTSYLTISGAQLLQYLTGAAPYTDKGLVVVTTDIATVPQVPDANTNTKWKRYLWIRQSVSLVAVYAWNTTAASDPTFLQWQSINVAGIGAGSIVNAMIADNTIQDVKIANLSYSKLIGVPTGLPPSGIAGGDLLGSTYPNPVIAALAISTAKLADLAVTGAKIAAKTVAVGNLLSSGAARQMTRVQVADTTVVEWFQPSKIVDLDDSTIAALQLRSVRVNAAGTGFEVGTHTILQRAIFQSTAIVSSAGNLANSTTTPVANATGLTALFNTGAFVPISVLSKFIIECDVKIGLASSFVFVGLYNVALGSGATAPLAGTGIISPNATGNALASARITYVSGTGLVSATYYLMFGVLATSAYMNSIDGANNPFLISASTISITEYI